MTEERLMPYQESFPDGFITNKLLKKAKTKAGIIYSAIDEESVLIHGSVFLPTWDTTDHLHFVCRRCKSVADILQVKFDDNYASDPKYALFFYLGCRKCGVTGQRKVYLDRAADACQYQKTYDEDKIYVYSDAEDLHGIVEITEKRLVKGETEKQEKA